MRSARKILATSSRRLLTSLGCLLIFAVGAPARGAVTVTTVVPSPDPQLKGFFGTAVSLSADGQTALIGSLQSRAYVFVRQGDGWSLSARLPAAGAGAMDFGETVALSADGMVAAVSAPGESACLQLGQPVPCGTVHVYVRTGGNWVERALLTPPYFFDFELNFGVAMALSADGSTLLIGRSDDDCVTQPCRGAVFDYERTGDDWVFTATLKGSNPLVQRFGGDVSLTPDGSTALIGASDTPCGAGEHCGEAYLFTRSGGSWTESARLLPAVQRAEAYFGFSVGLSADGSSALVGAPQLTLGSGPAFVSAFQQTSGVWTELQEIPGGPVGDAFGLYLRIAADGQSALVGAPWTSCAQGTFCGAVYQLVRTGSGSWSSRGSLGTFPAESAAGTTVALASDGTTGLAGVPGASCSDVDFCGAFYSFSGLQAAPAIPALGGPGLAALTLALIAAALILLRRRRSI